MTKIFAHRGSVIDRPENTMAAFRRAAEVGADGIEFDVQFSKDDELVVIHDLTVDRTTEGTGLVRQHSFKELRDLDAGSYFSPEYKGERIPHLTEVLDWLAGTDLLLNIELKYLSLDYDNFEESILMEISKRKLEDRTIISSFNHEALKKINEMMPAVETGILYMARLYEPWKYAEQVGAKGLHPFIEGVDGPLVATAEQKGFPVRPFTVNDENQIASLIKAGCSAIITDDPKRAFGIKKQILNEG